MGHDIRLVVTRADRRRGRRGEPEPTPVKATAVELGIPVSHRVDDVLATDASLGVVVAFGRLVKPHVLHRMPMVNLHFSLLPRWRGAAPVERAILAGDSETGVCLMALEEGLDTGPLFARERVAVGDDEHAGELRERLVEAGTGLLVGALASGLGEPEPQVGEPTYADKITSEDLHIDWALPSEQVLRVVRLDRAWTTFRGRRLLVLRARPATPPPGLPPAAVLQPGAVLQAIAGPNGAPLPASGAVLVGTGDGAVELLRVQPEGRQAVDAGAWVRGARLEPGDSLGA